MGNDSRCLGSIRNLRYAVVKVRVRGFGRSIVGLEDTKKEGMSSHPLGAHRVCTYSIMG